jgi:hypothetical protein
MKSSTHIPVKGKFHEVKGKTKEGEAQPMDDPTLEEQRLQSLKSFAESLHRSMRPLSN